MTALHRRILDLLRRPVLAPLIANAALIRVLAVVGLMTLILGWGRVQWFPCPFLQVTHLPCPGCGLTRACLMLLRGNWSGAMHMHAMAPFFLLLIALLPVVALLPARLRGCWVESIERIERTTRILPLLLVVLFFYWIMRLGYRI
jgi:hypothetical protein